ncbi:MAG TPA: hypothetical protein VIH55_02515, partial [Acidimicrobiia bacterium]
ENVGVNESWWTEPQDVEPVDEVAQEEAQEEPEPSEPTKDSRFGHYIRAAAAAPSETFASPVESFEPATPEAEEEGDELYAEAPSFEPAAETEGVEEDTEAFLEKVFSQLEVNGQADVEEEGHGLLRRRRMGSVLKEIDED